jgi:hypothetical protein
MRRAAPRAPLANIKGAPRAPWRKSPRLSKTAKGYFQGYFQE